VGGGGPSQPVTRVANKPSPHSTAEEHCFALNSASLIDNALALTHIGGTYANTRPTEFMCLVLKLLQLQPEREIILEYLRAEEFK
jgi:pre-mRNA-splicing factor 38A